MWKIRNIALLFSLFALFFLLRTSAYAQFNMNLPATLSSELGVEISPTYPKPRDTVTINLTLYTDDLDSASISWFQNGRNVLNGKGKTSYSFEAGAAGEEARFEIRISLLGGTSFSKTFRIIPSDVALVWEANTYVPPFYRGKALHSGQGSLKVVAIPEIIRGGSRVSASNLIYKWSNNVKVYGNESGYGKNVLVLNGSLLGRSENISVLVTDPVSNQTAQGFIGINPSDPELVFYENNPYYGHIFNSAVSGLFDMDSEEVQLVAAPFYFSNEDSGSLKYEWRLNGALSPSLLGSRTAIFRKPETDSGRSIVSLQVANTNRVLQQSENSLIMDFSN